MEFSGIVLGGLTLPLPVAKGRIAGMSHVTSGPVGLSWFHPREVSKIGQVMPTSVALSEAGSVLVADGEFETGALQARQEEDHDHQPAGHRE